MIAWARFAPCVLLLLLCCSTVQANLDMDCADDALPPESPLRMFPPSTPSFVLHQLPSPTEVNPTPPTPADPAVSVAPLNSVHSLQPGDRERRTLKNKADVNAPVDLLTEFVFRSPEPLKETPFDRGEWSTEEFLRVPVTSAFSVFGQVSLNGDYVADQDMKVVGRTGVLYRVPVGGNTQFEFRGGPSIKMSDALRLEAARESAQFLLEVQCRWPILGQIGLEYDGAAQPAITPLDRTQLRQDLGLAFPMANGGGKLKVGAKHKYETMNTDQRAWTGAMEVYLGFELGR